MSILKPRLGVSALVLFAAASAHADDASQVQAASLEVKSRIKSMEQVNVTAEKSIDENAPAASAKVVDLLAELEALDSAPTFSHDRGVEQESGLAAGAVFNKQ